MNIFISTHSYDILNIQNGMSFYVDNERFDIDVYLNIPSKSVRIGLYLIHENNYTAKIHTSNGIFWLDRNNQDLILVYEKGWYCLNNKNLIPFIDTTFKQNVIVNMFGYGRMGENMIHTYERGSSSQSGKYKMSNLLIIGCSNFRGNKKSNYNGEGCVLIYKYSLERYFFNKLLSQGYDIENQIYQGNFGQHVKLLDMDTYDLLIVSAPSKVRDNNVLKSAQDDIFGYFYVYSYRKNIQNNFYFHQETKIPFPSISLTRNLNEIKLDAYIPYFSVFQIEPLDQRGIVVSFESKILYYYDLRDLENITHQINTTLNPEFIKIKNNDFFISTNQSIRRIQYTNNIFGNTMITIFNNTFGVNNFGRIVYPYSNGIVIISQNDFFDLDINFQLKKRITFSPSILSFDMYENGSERFYYILLNSFENNVYSFDKNYTLIISDLLKTFPDDVGTMIRVGPSGETLFVSIPNHTDVKNNIPDMGSLVQFDINLSKEKLYLSSLFPDFDIRNQILIEEKTLNEQKVNFVEESFYGQLTLISNDENIDRNVEKIYQVNNDNGILLELNYDVSNSSFLSIYAKYFIYSDPTLSTLISSAGTTPYSYILNSNNQYLGWSNNQMLNYNNTKEHYEIYIYKNSSSKIKIVLLGIGILQSQKRWNVIESEMSSDLSKNNYDISMNFSGLLDLNQFVRFKKFTHNQDVIFLIHNYYSIHFVDYFGNKTYVKTFTRNISGDLFYFDSFKNLFHLFRVGSQIFLSIYKGSEYDSFLLNSVKTDLTTMPFEIACQYYDQTFVFLENYHNENNSAIEIRRFDIRQDLVEKIEFEEINISNEFSTKKYLVDIEFEKDKIAKVILVNYSEKDNKIFQIKSQKIYTLPNLFSTKFSNYRKKNVRQLNVSENKFVHHELYEINDKIPNVFYNIKYQKYFNRLFGILINYQFTDNRNKIYMDEDNNIQLIKPNQKYVTRYVTRPEKNYKIETYLFDEIEQSIILTAKKKSGFTGPQSYVEIIDVSSNSYVFKESGEVNGITIQKKYWNKDIAYETLDNLNTYFVSENYDPSTNTITFWTFSDTNQYVPQSTILTLPILTNSSNIGVYRTPNEEWITNTIQNQKIIYFQKISNQIFEKHIDVSGLNIQIPFDIEIQSSSFFTLKDNTNKKYLFVKNILENIWKYFGNGLEKIPTNHINTFELTRDYYIDLDISQNPNLFQSTNVHLQSDLFYDSEKRFYSIQPDGIYKLNSSLTSDIFETLSISSDGKSIYSQNALATSQKINYLDHSIYGKSTQIVNTPYYCPESYKNNFISSLEQKGYFTMTTLDKGFSKLYIFDPNDVLIDPSRVVITSNIDFGLVDSNLSIYPYYSPKVKKYVLNTMGTKYIFDSSRNATNYELNVNSIEKIFTNSKFSTITYDELKLSSNLMVMDSFLENSNVEIKISYDGSKVYAFHQGHLYIIEEMIENYPLKYKWTKTLVASNQLNMKIDLLDDYSDLKIDPIRQHIYIGYGGLGATGTNFSKVSILVMDENSSVMNHFSDLSGDNSFGYQTLLSDDGKYLFVSEPKTPANQYYQEGKIYQYEWLNDEWKLKREIRSNYSKIGYLMRLSSNGRKLATYGYKKGSEELNLVIFSDIHLDNYFETSISSDIYDMVFIGDSEILFVEENLTYQDNNKSRVFYLIQDVNSCENIFTKIVLPNYLFEGDNTMYDMIAFGQDMILFQGTNVNHIIQIKDYQFNYISSQPKVSINAKQDIAKLGNTMVSVVFEEGGLSFVYNW
jgi:hypothetical protein